VVSRGQISGSTVFVLPYFLRRQAKYDRPGGLPIANEPRVNEKIRAKEVRLVDPSGGQVGIKGIDEARWLADQLGLDLVEVAPDARPPVVRLMDYGKFKYEASVKAREARKNQTRTVIKEVQFRPKIASSDFDVKRKRVEKFLRNGDKVKVVMRFRGREVTHPELGRDILQRLEVAVEDLGAVETMPRLDGRQMTMVLAPLRRQRIKDDSGSHKTNDGPAEVNDAPAEVVADDATADVAADDAATEAATAETEPEEE
jgi:translation initiation factor IF-3